MKWVQALGIYLGQAILAGAVCAVVMAYLLGKHPIEWGNLGEWATAIGTFVLAWVAYVQLGTANRNELIRNSIRAVEDLQRPRQVFDLSITPMDAATETRDLVNAPMRLVEYRRVMEDHYAGRPQSAEDRTLRARGYYTAVIASNYFTTLYDLIRRGVVERRYVFDKLGDQIVATFEAIERHPEINWNLTFFRKLAEEARAFVIASRNDSSLGL